MRQGYLLSGDTHVPRRELVAVGDCRTPQRTVKRRRRPIARLDLNRDDAIIVLDDEFDFRITLFGLEIPDLQIKLLKLYHILRLYVICIK